MYRQNYGIGSSVFNQVPEEYRSGFAEYVKQNPIGAGGQAITPVGLPDGGSVMFSNTASAGAFKNYLKSIGVETPKIVAPTASLDASPAPGMSTPQTTRYGRKYGLPQSMVNYLNQPLPDISGILSLPVAQSEPIDNEEIESLTTTGLTPEQLALLYPQPLNVLQFQGGGEGGYQDEDTTIGDGSNLGINSLGDLMDFGKQNLGTLGIGAFTGFDPFTMAISLGYQARQRQKATAAAEAARVKANEAIAQRAREEEQAKRAQQAYKDVYASRQESSGRSSFGSQTAEEAAYGSCFIAGTKVTMENGTTKNIEDVKVGDKVKGHKGNNEVIKLDPTLLANRKLYSFNDNEHYFFTSEHPFMTEEGWKSIKPEKTKERDGIELYNQLVGELKIGDKLVTEKGLIEIKEIKSKEMNDPKMPLYNFNISNDNSYIADGYVVHNKGGSSSNDSGEGGYGGFCFDPNTPIQMADGSEKKIKDIQLGDDTKGGEVTGVFQFKAADEIHDYKGVTVAGSHFVKEDGKFIMVKDSPLAVKIDKIPVVYSLDTSGRRIFIKDIEFADYNGDGVAKNFLTNAGVDLSGFDKEVLRQVENRLI